MSRIFRSLLPLFVLIYANPGLAGGLPKPSKLTPFFEAAQFIIQEVRPAPDFKDLKKFIEETPRTSPMDTPESISKALAKHIFETWKIEPDTSYQSRKSRDNVLPDSVLAARRGHCLGISTLYLLAAEQIGVDAALVRAPDHVFVRLCKASQCVNVETLKRGAIVTDAYYIENLTIPKAAIEAGNYMASLRAPAELAASLYLGLGYVSASSGQRDLAALFYEKSAEKSPRFAEAYSNLASLKSEMGAPSEEVLGLLKKAESANPTHYATALNLAAFYQNKKSVADSLRYYDRAVQSNPVSFVAYQRRATLLSQMGRKKDALGDLERALIIQPKSCAVREARQELRKNLGIAPASDTDLKTLRATGECQ